MSDVVGQAFVELRARGTLLGADIRNTVNQAVPAATAETTTATRSLRAELKTLTRDFTGMFGQTAVASTALRGFGAVETAAAAGASSLATPLVLATAGVIGLGAGAASARKEFAGFAGDVVQFQRFTGASVEQASAFVAVFERFGLPVETAGRALAFLARNADQNQEKLAKLGVTLAANADGSINIAESYRRVADAVKNTSDEQARYQIIQLALGRSGLALLPVLLRGADGFDALAAQAKAAGLTVNEEGIQRFKEMKQATHELGEAFSGIKVRLGSVVAPAFTGLARVALPALEAVGKGVDLLLQGVVDIGLLFAKPSRILHLDKLNELEEEALGRLKRSTGATEEATAGLEDYVGGLTDAEQALLDFISTQISADRAVLGAQGAAFSFADAQLRVTDTQRRYNDLLHRSGEVARDYAAAQRALASATFDVGQRERELAIAVLESGRGSNRTAQAAEALRAAREGQASATQQVADLDTATGPRGTDTLRVAGELARARLAEKEAALAAVEANVLEKETAQDADGVVRTAADHAANLRTAFSEFARTLAPGSELRRNIEDTGRAIRDALPTKNLLAQAFGAFAPNPAGVLGPTLFNPAFGATQPNPPGVSGPTLAGTVNITNVFSQPIDTAQAAALNKQQAAGVGGGSTRRL